MKINNKQKSIIKKLGSVIIFKFFFITKLPISGLAGLKLKEINYSSCKTNVYHRYLIRIHLNGMRVDFLKKSMSKLNSNVKVLPVFET